jgi:hypothetical protein
MDTAVTIILKTYHIISSNTYITSDTAVTTIFGTEIYF